MIEWRRYQAAHGLVAWVYGEDLGTPDQFTWGRVVSGTRWKAYGIADEPIGIYTTLAKAQLAVELAAVELELMRG